MRLKATTVPKGMYRRDLQPVLGLEWSNCFGPYFYQNYPFEGRGFAPVKWWNLASLRTMKANVISIIMWGHFTDTAVLQAVNFTLYHLSLSTQCCSSTGCWRSSQSPLSWWSLQSTMLDQSTWGFASRPCWWSCMDSWWPWRSTS